MAALWRAISHLRQTHIFSWWKWKAELLLFLSRFFFFFCLKLGRSTFFPKNRTKAELLLFLFSFFCFNQCWLTLPKNANTNAKLLYFFLVPVLSRVVWILSKIAILKRNCLVSLLIILFQPSLFDFLLKKKTKPKRNCFVSFLFLSSNWGYSSFPQQLQFQNRIILFAFSLHCFNSGLFDFFLKNRNNKAGTDTNTESEEHTESEKQKKWERERGRKREREREREK